MISRAGWGLSERTMGELGRSTCPSKVGGWVWMGDELQEEVWHAARKAWIDAWDGARGQIPDRLGGERDDEIRPPLLRGRTVSPAGKGLYWPD